MRVTENEAELLKAVRAATEEDPEIARLAHMGSSWALVIRAAEGLPPRNPGTRFIAERMTGLWLAGQPPPSFSEHAIMADEELGKSVRRQQAEGRERENVSPVVPKQWARPSYRIPDPGEKEHEE